MLLHFEDDVMDMEQVVEKLDCVLGTGKFDTDVKTKGVIATDLCQLIFDDLDSEEQEAVHFARRYWNGKGGEEERLIHLHRAGGKMDTIMYSGNIGTLVEAVKRLVCCAIMTTGGIDEVVGLFVSDWAELAGIEVQTLDRIYRARLPGYA